MSLQTRVSLALAAAHCWYTETARGHEELWWDKLRTGLQGGYRHRLCFLLYSTCSSSSGSSDGDGNNGNTSGNRGDGGGGSSSSYIVAVAAAVVDCICSSRLCDGSNILNYSRLMYFNMIFALFYQFAWWFHLNSNILVMYIYICIHACHTLLVSRPVYCKALWCCFCQWHNGIAVSIYYFYNEYEYDCCLIVAWVYWLASSRFDILDQQFSTVRYRPVWIQDYFEKK